MWKKSNCPSSTGHLELNPWRFEHESSSIATRPGLSRKIFTYSMPLLKYSLSWKLISDTNLGNPILQLPRLNLIGKWFIWPQMTWWNNLWLSTGEISVGLLLDLEVLKSRKSFLESKVNAAKLFCRKPLAYVTRWIYIMIGFFYLKYLPL